MLTGGDCEEYYGSKWEEVVEGGENWVELFFKIF